MQSNPLTEGDPAGPKRRHQIILLQTPLSLSFFPLFYFWSEWVGVETSDLSTWIIH
jgi:hypothetical protein